MQGSGWGLVLMEDRGHEADRNTADVEMSALVDVGAVSCSVAVDDLQT